MTARKPIYPVTPDGRYFVVRGRLWRMSDPKLPADEHDRLGKELMAARRKVATTRKAADERGESAAHEPVDRAKLALGERGPVWRDDGGPDLNRHMAPTTAYADWYRDLAS